MPDNRQVKSITVLARDLDSVRGVIAVDGFHGAGKTTFAREMSRLLGIERVELDRFVDPSKKSFVHGIRYEELLEALGPRPVIVEGVCVLDVLARAGVAPNYLVYVDSSMPKEDTPRGSGPLAAEVAAYHAERNPRQQATHIYNPLHIPTGTDMRDPKVDIAYINAKTRLAIALVIGGVVTLLVGLALLMYGVTGTDTTLIEVAGAEMSASGLGGVIMTTSIAWAFFAYRSRPKYARTREISEKYDADRDLVERNEREASTQTMLKNG